MHIRRLHVSNFRAVKNAHLEDLSDMVVIAGPNGSGKSCLFDAIRLLKSVYGGYQPNEWQQWFGEFQINLDRNQPQILTLFQDRSIPLDIEFEIELHHDEEEFIRENSSDQMTRLIWEQFSSRQQAGRYPRGAPVAAQMREFGKEVEDRVQKEVATITDELGKPSYTGRLRITPDLKLEPLESPMLQLVFSVFLPQDIGIIDYHGAQRTYAREQVGGINLNIDTSEERLSQHALYNFASKYSNIKTEMASSYIRSILSEESGASSTTKDELLDTLSEMFSLFFPDKEFLGPRPTEDGRLLFPVKTEAGFEHDINDLSSGEKEVLYGYLRLRNVSPEHSVLLLDEPELHLNPRLIQGLPQFYYRHLGRSLDNQIWLLTHSDTLLREALSTGEISVFHMQLPHVVDQDENQVRRIEANEELDRAIIDLVGDLATYRPGAKVVIFEGGGDTEFDLFMVNTLFPDFQTTVNPVSGGDKIKVREIHELLESARKAGAVPAQFFSIVDRDSERQTAIESSTALSWDVYHIENFLLAPRFIHAALEDALGNENTLEDETSVERALKNAARETLVDLVRHRLETEANRSLVSKIRTNTDRSLDTVAQSLHQAIAASLERLQSETGEELSEESLECREEEERKRYEADLQSDDWKSTFRGRDILKRFVSTHAKGARYELFRNLVLAKMRDAGHQPDGMAEVIRRILDE